jgi:hypothetical protein
MGAGTGLFYICVVANLLAVGLGLAYRRGKR